MSVIKQKQEQIIETIAGIIKNEINSHTTLKLKDISDDLDLNHLDVDSMKLMILMGEIESKLANFEPTKNIELGYEVVYENSTIKKLATYIANKSL